MTYTPYTGGSYLTQTTWYIDPQNSSGTASDVNNGSTTSTPLKSFAELERRWGYGGHIAQNTNVFMLSNGKSTDPFNIRLSIDSNVVLAIYGGSTTTVGSGATSLQTGTFSSVTNLARATNTPTQATDSLGRSWTSFLGKRVRDTTTNAIAWVAKDLTGGAVRLSSPSINGGTFLLPTVTTTTFNTTNTYQIEDLRQLWFGDVICTMGNGLNNALAFQDIEFQNNSVNYSVPGISFVGCRFKSSNFSITSFNVLIGNCDFESSFTCYAPITWFDAGLMRSGGIIARQGEVIIDGDLLSQTAPLLLAGGSVVIGAMAVFDAATLAGGNPRGSGIVVGGTGNGTRNSGAALRIQTSSHGVAAIYGSGNAGYGLDVFPTHRVNVVSGATLAITGTSGDFILGSDATNTTYATKATGSTVPAYGLAITPSWTNFAAAQPGGFNGNAHNISEDAHLITN